MLTNILNSQPQGHPQINWGSPLARGLVAVVIDGVFNPVNDRPYTLGAGFAGAVLRAYAPQDQILHGIADRLQAAQRQNFYQLSADVTHRGRYYHEYCMSIDVSRDSPTGQPPTAGSEETVVETLRDLARWLYRQLEAEYDHLTSDEAVEEGIVINEYTFTEGGRRFG